jgi:hypothetical protein
MRRAADWKWIGLALLLLGTKCSSQPGLPPPGADGSTGAGGIGGTGTGGVIVDHVGGMTGSAGKGMGGEIGILGGTTGSAGKGMGGGVIETIGGMSGSAGKDGGTGSDAVVCCPPDPQPMGCTHLGGASLTGMCGLACDFFNSSRWRIETDAYGCPVWRYDGTGGCSPDAAAPKMCFDGGD